MDQDQHSQAHKVSTTVENLFWASVVQLKPLLDDPDVTEIAINGDEAFVFTSGVGGRKKHNIHISQRHIKGAITALATLNTKDVTKKADAIISQKLGDYRVTGVLSPVSYKGHILRIRKHTMSDMSLDDMVAGGSFSEDQKLKLIEIVESGANYLVAGGTSSGKAQPLHSVVLTPNGFKAMGNIKIGDDVLGWDGSTNYVMGVYPQGEKEIYRVSAGDYSMEACWEHLFPVVNEINVIEILPLYELSRRIDLGETLYLQVLKEFNEKIFLPIHEIKRIGYMQAQCISVSSEDSTYITDDYIITHNTTAMNAMIAYIPQHESVVTIESGIELKVKAIDNTRLLEFPEHNIGSDTLLQTTLRLTPDRIIVGEIRKPIEAATYLEVLGAGHDGCSATIHANSARLTLMRFDSLVASHTQDSMLSIRSRTASVLEYVIHFHKDKRTHKRSLSGIVKIVGLDVKGEYILEDVI